MRNIWHRLHSQQRPFQPNSMLRRVGATKILTYLPRSRCWSLFRLSFALLDRCCIFLHNRLWNIKNRSVVMNIRWDVPHLRIKNRREYGSLNEGRIGNCLIEIMKHFVTTRAYKLNITYLHRSSELSYCQTINKSSLFDYPFRCDSSYLWFSFETTYGYYHNLYYFAIYHKYNPTSTFPTLGM